MLRKLLLKSLSKRSRPRWGYLHSPMGDIGAPWTAKTGAFGFKPRKQWKNKRLLLVIGALGASIPMALGVMLYVNVRLLITDPVGWKSIANRNAMVNFFSTASNEPSKASVGLSKKLVAETISVDELNQRYRLLSVNKSGNGSTLGQSGESFSSSDSKLSHAVDIHAIADYVCGTGAYGHVVKAIDRSGRPVAIKVVHEDAMPFSSLQTEVSALKKARKHPSVNELIEVLYCKDTASYCIVTSFCEGGELYDRLMQRGPYTEICAAQITERIASALKHIHSSGFAHMDVKPENLLFASAGRDSNDANNMRLIDFGMAVSLDDYKNFGSTMISSNIGTTPYLAPEILRGVISERQRFDDGTDEKPPNRKSRFWLRLHSDPRACDMFSLGIVLYIMLLGCHPFDRDGDADDSDIVQRMIKGSRQDQTSDSCRSQARFTFDVHESIQLSSGVKKLISGLLDPDPSLRLTAADVLQDPWIKTAEKNYFKYRSMQRRRKLSELERAEAIALLASSIRREANSQSKASLNRNAVIESAFKMLSKSDWDRIWNRAGRSAKVDFNEFEQTLSASTLQFDVGDVVFSRGDQVDGIYIIIDGAVEIEYVHENLTQDANSECRGEEESESVEIKSTNSSLNGHVVGCLESGDIFGETGVLDGRDIRNATIRCVKPLECVFWPRDDFVCTISGFEDTTLCKGLEEHVRGRQTARARELLTQVAGLEFSSVVYKKNDILYPQDSNSDTLYLLLDGYVETSAWLHDTSDKNSSSIVSVLQNWLRTLDNWLPVFRFTNAAVNDDTVALRVYSPGELVGTEAATGAPRFATARCLTDARLLSLDRSRLVSLFSAESSLHHNLLRLSRRDAEQKRDRLREIVKELGFRDTDIALSDVADGESALPVRVAKERDEGVISSKVVIEADDKGTELEHLVGIIKRRASTNMSASPHSTA